MNLKSILSYYTFFAAALVLLLAVQTFEGAKAQSNKSSTLRVANSTNATLTIIVNRGIGGGNPKIETIPPLTEKTLRR